MLGDDPCAVACVVVVDAFFSHSSIAVSQTFGAVYGKNTNDQIGAVEMLIATAWCGIVYALLGGQPMVRIHRCSLSPYLTAPIPWYR